MYIFFMINAYIISATRAARAIDKFSMSRRGKRKTRIVWVPLTCLTLPLHLSPFHHGYVSLSTCPCAKNMRKVCESVEESTRRRFCNWSKPVSFLWICWIGRFGRFGRFAALFWFLYLFLVEDSSMCHTLSLSASLCVSVYCNFLITLYHSVYSFLFIIYHIFYS